MDKPTTIARYNLAAPTEADLLVSLSRLMTPDQSRQLWTAACRSVHVQSPLSLDQFERALMQLKEEKGMASISAVSILVRLKSFKTLSLINAK